MVLMKKAKVARLALLNYVHETHNTVQMPAMRDCIAGITRKLFKRIAQYQQKSHLPL